MKAFSKKISVTIALMVCFVCMMSMTVYAAEIPLPLDDTYVEGTVSDEELLYNIVLPSDGYLSLTVESTVFSLDWNMYANGQKLYNDDRHIFDGSVEEPKTETMKLALKAGTYTFTVRKEDKESPIKVKASFEAVASNDAESNDTFATAMTLPGNQLVTGFLGLNDEFDYYKVTVSGAGTFSFDISTFLSLYVDVFDANQKGIKESTITCYSDTVAAERTTELALKAGTYYIRIGRYSGSGAGTYTIKFNDTVATGIQLNKTYLEIEPNEIYQLEVNMLPAGAVTPELKWSSSNTDLLGVYDDGRVRSYFELGVATITVKTTDGSNLSATCKVVIKPEKVTYVRAKEQTMKSITLTWEEQEGADGYRIYQYDAKKKAYVKIKDTSKRYYKVSKLKTESKYKFKVQAYVKVDGKKIFGKLSSAKTLYTAPKKLGATKITSIKRTTRTSTMDYITVKWKKVKGATGYYVYGKAPGGSYELLDIVKGTKSYLEAGRGYTYSIKVAPIRTKHNITTIGKMSKPKKYSSK